MNNSIIQIGSCFGNIDGGDPIFDNLNISNNIVLVEPINFLFSKLVENYNNKYPNNNFVFLNKAVSTYNGKLKMYTPDKNELLSKRNSKKDSWCWGLASINPNHAGNHWGFIKNVTEIEVECITLNKLIFDNNIIDISLLHIDTEGHDIDILLSYDFTIKPRTIIFENAHTDGTHKRGKKYTDFINFIKDKGYYIHKETKQDTTLKLNIL